MRPQSARLLELQADKKGEVGGRNPESRAAPAVLNQPPPRWDGGAPGTRGHAK